MRDVDRAVLAERSSAIERDLERVEGRLPSNADLAERLVRAAGFRNVLAHAYESIDMQRVYRAASSGPTDLRKFLAALRDRV